MTNVTLADYNDSIKLLEQACAGQQPLLNTHPSSQEVAIINMFYHMRHAHFIPEDPWVYFSSEDDTDADRKAKGDTSIVSYAEIFKEERQELKGQGVAKYVENYNLIGRRNTFDENDADTVVMLPDGPRSLLPFFQNIYPKLLDGTWPETKKIVIVNKKEFDHIPWFNDNFYSPIIDAFDLNKFKAVKIVTNEKQAISYIKHTLGGNASQPTSKHENRVDASDPETTFNINTANTKKPREAEIPLRSSGVVGRIIPWVAQIGSPRKAPELSKTSSGNNEEKITYAHANLWLEGMKNFRQRMIVEYERALQPDVGDSGEAAFESEHPTIVRMIEEIEDYGLPVGGMAALQTQLKDENTYHKIQASVRYHLAQVGQDYKRDLVLCDDRSLSMYVMDSAGRIDYQMSFALFTETEAFRGLVDDGTLNTHKTMPGAELAKVLEQFSLERFYEMVKEATQELVYKYGDEKNWESVDDVMLECDDVQLYTYAKLFQEDYAAPVTDVVHAIKRSRHNLDPLPVDELEPHIREVHMSLTSENYAGPTQWEKENGLADPDKNYHIQYGQDFYTTLSAMAKGLETVSYRSGANKQAKTLRYQMKNAAQDDKPQHQLSIAVLTPAQRDSLETRMPTGSKIITIFDEEFGLKAALENDEAMLSDVFQKFIAQSDAFIFPPDMGEDQTPILGKDMDYFAKATLFRMIQVGEQLFDSQLVHGKPIYVCPDSAFNDLMLGEHNALYKKGGIGETPAHLLILKPLESRMLGEKRVTGVLSNLKQRMKQYARVDFVPEEDEVKVDNIGGINHHQYFLTGYGSATKNNMPTKRTANMLFHAATLLKVTTQTGGGASGEAHMGNFNDGHYFGIEQLEENSVYSRKELENINLIQSQCVATRNLEGPHKYKGRPSDYEVMHQTIHGRKEQLSMTKAYLLGKGINPSENENAEVAVMGGIGTIEEIEFSILHRLAEVQRRSGYYSSSPLILMNEDIEGTPYFEYRLKEILTPDVMEHCNIVVASDWIDALEIVVDSRRNSNMEPSGVDYAQLLEMNGLEPDEYDRLQEIALQGINHQNDFDENITALVNHHSEGSLNIPKCKLG